MSEKTENSENKYPVLDKGWVQLVDHMGSDSRIVQAARISKGKEGATSNDEGFIRDLWKMGHTSPFEQVVLTYRIKAPIFVARQMMRHRTARVNELSLRFTESALEFYMPSEDRLGEHPDTARGYIETLYTQAAGCYKTMIAAHVKKEVARVMLPLATYTQFFWQMDLHNLLHFLRLREAVDAQWEMRQYAETIEKLAARVCPLAFKAWEAKQ